MKLLFCLLFVLAGILVWVGDSLMELRGGSARLHACGSLAAMAGIAIFALDFLGALVWLVWRAA